MPHAPRPEFAARHPLLVTLRLADGNPSLRRVEPHALFFGVLRVARARFGMRIVQITMLTNHVHLIVEARDAAALSRGMRAFGVRIARGLNRICGRAGSVLADRFHSRVLRTPREVRYALAYVLGNARKHGIGLASIDPFSSASSFDGWGESAFVETARSRLRGLPVALARSWLLNVGWRRWGLISVWAIPGSA